MLNKMLENVRTSAPLVHNITNYVTVNDCANVLLACGGSPIMSDDVGEVEDITTICGGLTINIGTLNARTIPAMALAGKKANALGHPVVLDPVGAGASGLRTRTAMDLLQSVRFTAIRGNVSEIKALAQMGNATRGVDAAISDKVTAENLDQMVRFAKGFAKETNAIIAMTGAMDIVADAHQAYVIKNGHAMMGRITGTGCMLSCMMCAYLVANPLSALNACAAAVAAMGLCGQMGHEQTMHAKGGNASLRNAIIDNIYNLTGEQLMEGVDYEIR